MFDLPEGTVISVTELRNRMQFEAWKRNRRDVDLAFIRINSWLRILKDDMDCLYREAEEHTTLSYADPSHAALAVRNKAVADRLKAIHQHMQGEIKRLSTALGH